MKVSSLATLISLALTCTNDRGRAAAQPTHLDGEYHFGCASNQSSLTLGLLFLNGEGKLDEQSSTTPIYCGSHKWENETGYDHNDTEFLEYQEYQERLDASEALFEEGCNDAFSNSNKYFCSNASSFWREGLENINDMVAGLVPERLQLEVEEERSWWEEWILGVWSTETELVLREGRELPIDYTIDDDGNLLGLLLEASPLLELNTNVGCTGVLGVQSNGLIQEDGASTLVNKYAGLLACGTTIGDLPLAYSIRIGVEAYAEEVMDA